jgi:hypothetical protein
MPVSEVRTTHWSSSDATLTNGTLSLALKHQLAYLDIIHRALPKALILEDDSVLPPDLWGALDAYLRIIPADAHIFYAGSYSPNPRGGSLRDADVVGRAAMDVKSRWLAPPTLHVRTPWQTNGTRPAIVGSNAYIVTLSGARTLLQPVVAETDVQLSLLSPTPLCKRTPRTCFPPVGLQGCGAIVPRSGCGITAPPHQYGPTRWLIWQDPSARNKLSHKTRSKAASAAERRMKHGNVHGGSNAPRVGGR